MQTKELTRQFSYNGIKLPDPNPSLEPEKAKNLFVQRFPEIINATIEGPQVQGDHVIYTITRAIGQKG